MKQKIFTYDYMHNTSYFSIEDDHKQEELVYHSTVRYSSPPSVFMSSKVGRLRPLHACRSFSKGPFRRGSRLEGC